MSYAETNGISLYYETHGTGDPLVLLHGGFGSLETFDGVRDALGVGRQLVLVDLQGHGRTPEADRPLTIETLADDVAGLIEQLCGTADVLGYSFGGAVALRLALQHPERVRNLVVVWSPPSARATSQRSSPPSTRWTRASPRSSARRRCGRPTSASPPTRPPSTPSWPRRSTSCTTTTTGRRAGRAETADAAAVRRRRLDPPRPHARDGRADRHRPPRRGLRRLGPADQSARDPPRCTHYDVLASPLFVPAVDAFLQSGRPA